MQEFIAFNEQRAGIYWWMSSLFSRELSDADLTQYHDGDLYTLLSSLAMTESLKAPVEMLRTALQKSQAREHEQLELAADFCGLFLSTPKSGALPYASMYIGETGLLNDKPALDMNVWLEDYGIAQRAEFNEPADHLAVELDFMGNLIIMSNQQETAELREELMQAQLSFLNSMLLNWLPLFTKQCQERDNFGFYAAASSLLLAFCKLDATFLAGE